MLHPATLFRPDWLASPLRRSGVTLCHHSVRLLVSVWSAWISLLPRRSELATGVAPETGCERAFENGVTHFRTACWVQGTGEACLLH